MTWHLPDPDTQPEFYADVPMKRLAAWGVDTVIILVFTLLATLLTAFVGLLFFPLLFLTLGFVYRTATLASGSATWGMRLMAIEFRTFNGEKFDLPAAALHTLGYTVSFGMIFVQAISVVLMMASPRGQGLSDLMLGTVAINRRATR
ncbi:RDD family protein [Pseudohalocynthiibacter aestuariivivens]|uniref:RDD family protein n=1 Tax=Roseovarius pelagicus TaxID=2980108 RepID=A0ABY6DBG0_9RHOB|nr:MULTISPECIES: RDD family protein [Rhodobacterales]QIE44744.1 RDD family protein [Pseudohalocynthiibacter aestuariivivens]UXX83344.1 RDD family protein [Roseovarius pelagicus]